MNARELIELTDYTPRKYSGRAMYGKQCLGVEIDRYESPYEFFAALIENAAEEAVERLDDEGEVAVYDTFEEVSRMMRRTRSDSLGLGMILYWPHIPWEEDDSDGEGSESAA